MSGNFKSKIVKGAVDMSEQASPHNPGTIFHKIYLETRLVALVSKPIDLSVGIVAVPKLSS